MQRIFGFNSFSRRVVPTKVPLVPSPATKCVICPLRLLPDFRRRSGVMRRGIRRIPILIGIEIFLAVRLVNFAHAPDRAVGSFVARRGHDLDAVRRQNLLSAPATRSTAGKASRDSPAPRRSSRRRCRCFRSSRPESLCPGADRRAVRPRESSNRPRDPSPSRPD